MVELLGRREHPFFDKWERWCGGAFVALLSFGTAFMSLPNANPTDFLLARICFLVAWLPALVAIGHRLIAGPRTVRRVVASVIGLVAVGGISFATMRWVSLHETKTPSGDFKSINYYSLPNGELKQVALSFAIELRRFARNYQENDERIRNADWVSNVRNGQRQIESYPDEREKQGEAFAKSTTASLERHSAMQHEFKEKYIAPAADLVNALRQRIRNPPNRINRASAQALDGLLAGPDPVGELATYIEALATQLSH